MRHLRLLAVPALLAAVLTASPRDARADYVVVTWSDNSVHILDEFFMNIGGFPAGSTSPNGVATDGTLVYTGHFTSQEVYAYDFDGNVQFSWSSPLLFGLQGLELVDGELALANANGIDFVNPADGAFIRNIPSQGSCEGIGYDGELLWMISDANLYGVDPDDGAVITTIPNAAVGCPFEGTGISPDGNGNLALVCADGDFFIVSPADGSVILSANNNFDMYGSDFIEPPNESCDGEVLDLGSLTPQSGASIAVPGTTAAATDDIDESAAVECWGGSDAPEHVYSFTLASAAWLQIDTEGAGYDTKLAIVAGCPAGELWCQYNDDVGGGNLWSSFPCTQYPAGSYSAIVSGYLGGTGAYQLNFTECSPCGDGILDPGEECDDEDESASCDADCTFASCGDGTVNMTAGETCDDAGETPTCDSDCTAVACGDGLVNEAAGEVCDDAGESATCDSDCTAVACGDGLANATAGEQCDDGGESAACDTDCTTAMCGDSTVNTTAGETCDDGGRSATCNANCTTASCGDGILNTTAGEECDGDGAGTPGETATCDADCTMAMCGDTVVNAAAGEECDDGDESATCDADCTAATCGDGTLNVSAGEECDDGNTDDGDGCSATCTEESTGTSGETGTSGSESSSEGGESSSEAGESSSEGGETSGTMTAGESSEGSGSEETTGGTGGSSDDGCSCSTDDPRGGALWSLFGLLGLGAVKRRRRS